MRRSVMTTTIAAPLLLLAIASSVGAAEPAKKRAALEIDAFGGLVKRNGLQPISDDTSTRNGGSALALGVHYRSGYFLAPFVEAAYYSLAASDRIADLGSGDGGPTLVLNRSWAFGFMGGVALDLWRVRLRAGLGAYDLFVRTVTSGTTSSAAAAARSTVSELDFGYLAGATMYPLVRERFRVGIEARVGLVVEGQIGFIALGATMGGDAFTF
jgi:hypothetical protein